MFGGDEGDTHESMNFSQDNDPTSGVGHVSRAVGIGYGVKLPVFEGPLDLLLHLIRHNEVEITDIPVAEIAVQYLEYLEIMRSLDLDVAAEYLVMAATLAQIKSRMLLPPVDDEGADDELDPRAELVARLLEYQRYKEVAEGLGRLRWLDRDVYTSTGMEPDAPSEEDREIEVGLFELIEAFRLVLRGTPELPAAGVHVVETEEVTVRDQMIWVMQTVEDCDTIEFHRLFAASGNGQPTRPVLIATFLAILELTRLQAISIYQGANEFGVPDGAIRLRPTRMVSEVAWSERITELM